MARNPCSANLPLPVDNSRQPALGRRGPTRKTSVSQAPSGQGHCPDRSSVLRDRRFSAYKFRRQHRVGEYFLDFYCAEARYNLEADGGQPGFPEQQAQDKARDEYLKSRNIQTRRFWNSQLKDVRFVRDTIWADLQARASHPGNVRPEKRVRPTR